MIKKNILIYINNYSSIHMLDPNSKRQQLEENYYPKEYYSSHFEENYYNLQVICFQAIKKKELEE